MIVDKCSYLLLVDKGTIIEAFIFPKTRKGLSNALQKAKTLLNYPSLQIYCGVSLVWSHPEKNACDLASNV